VHHPARFGWLGGWAVLLVGSIATLVANFFAGRREGVEWSLLHRRWSAGLHFYGHRRYLYAGLATG